jgi:hypothetical protein
MDGSAASAASIFMGLCGYFFNSLWQAYAALNI